MKYVYLYDDKRFMLKKEDGYISINGTASIRFFEGRNTVIQTGIGILTSRESVLLIGTEMKHTIYNLVIYPTVISGREKQELALRVNPMANMILDPPFMIASITEIIKADMGNISLDYEDGEAWVEEMGWFRNSGRMYS